ncbi:MAG: DnaD domain protein [Halanaerobiales bacterium]
MNKNFSKLLFQIRQSRQLTTAEKLILILLLHSNLMGETLSQQRLAEEADLTLLKTRETLKMLTEKGWLNSEKDKEKKISLEKKLKISQKKKSKELDKNIEQDQKGQKIIKKWSELFGTRQLTPSDFSKIQSYLDDGLEEEVVIEVMKIAAENARRNPVPYMNKIMTNYLEMGIKTLEDYKKARKERQESEGQIQGDNRKKEKTKKLYDIEELKKRGWNT